MDEIVILITVPSTEEGEKIGRYLVENKLAACANILPSIISIFAWEGKICQEQESLVILKSKRALFEKITEEVKKRHSYSVPEIIALSLVAGSPAYLDWIQKNTL
jgi:periplasmic divalent cation tolerance protein